MVQTLQSLGYWEQKSVSRGSGGGRKVDGEEGSTGKGLQTLEEGSSMFIFTEPVDKSRH